MYNNMPQLFCKWGYVIEKYALIFNFYYFILLTHISPFWKISIFSMSAVLEKN